VLGDQPTGRLEAVDTRHPDIHQNHIGAQCRNHGERLEAVGGLADHLQSRLGLHDQPVASPHERLIVDDHESQRLAGSGGVHIEPGSA